MVEALGRSKEISDQVPFFRPTLAQFYYIRMFRIIIQSTIALLSHECHFGGWRFDRLFMQNQVCGLFFQ